MYSIYLFNYTVTLVFLSLNGVTLQKLIFPIWFRIESFTFVCTVVVVHGSFNPFWTLFCGVYCPFGLEFCYQFYNHSVYCNLFGEACILQLPVSYEWDIKDCVLPEFAVSGEAFNTLWYVYRIAHAALSMNVSMSAGSTEWAIFISEVRIIIPRT